MQSEKQFKIRSKLIATRNVNEYRETIPVWVNEGDVVATTNAWAAQMLEAQVLPNKTFRNGENRGEDNTKLWIEVDVSTEHQHDLDPIIDGAIAALA